MGNEITTKGNDKTDGCWRSSKGVSPPHGSRAALPIACDALNARTVAVRSYHYVFCASSPASCHTCVTARYLSLGISSRIYVMAYQPPSSAQKERTRFAYDAPLLSCGLSLSRKPHPAQRKAKSRPGSSLSRKSCRIRQTRKKHKEPPRRRRNTDNRIWNFNRHLPFSD